MKIIDRYSEFIKPVYYNKMNKRVTEVTKLTNDDLSNGRPFAEACKEFLKRVMKDEEAFAASLKASYEQELKKYPVADQSKLKELEKRFDDLDRLIRSLYENYSRYVLPERQYRL